MKGILTLGKAILMLIIVALPGIMMAHSGHGDHSHDGWSIIHYFTQPEHALVSMRVLSERIHPSLPWLFDQHYIMNNNCLCTPPVGL